LRRLYAHGYRPNTNRVLVKVVGKSG
jgi:hypothetical protein